MRTIVGVMGSGNAIDEATGALAYELGAAIARSGWVLLNGGRSTGIMDASARGAAQAGGIVVGVLPDGDNGRASNYLTIALRTGLGDARNAVNVLSSDVVVAMRGGAGTLSEIALALKAGKRVVTLDFDPGSGFATWQTRGRLIRTANVEDAIAAIRFALEDDKSEA